MRLSSLFKLLYYPDGGDSGSSGGNSNLEASDMDILNSDSGEEGSEDEELEEEAEEIEEEEEEPARKPKKTKAEDEIPESDGEDEEDESKVAKGSVKDSREIGEEEPEIERFEGKPTFKQLKEAYPDISKRFPGMRDVYFRESEFSKHFADPEQAEDAAAKAETFDALEGTLMEGDPRLLFTQLSENNPAAFKKLVPNILPEIRKMSTEMYLEVTIPVIDELLYRAAEHARKIGGQQGQNLLRSAGWLADFVHANGGEIPDITKSESRHPAEVQLEKERERHASIELNRALTDVNNRIDRSIRASIMQGINPKLTPYERDRVIERVLDDLESGLSQDKSFGLKMRGLWKRAQIAQYSENSKVAIAGAHITRSGNYIRELREKYTREALAGHSRSNQQKIQKRPFDSNGRGGGSGNRDASVLDSSKIDYRHTTDADILADRGGDRIKLKGRSKSQ